jgi:hypothetical protein
MVSRPFLTAALVLACALAASSCSQAVGGAVACSGPLEAAGSGPAPSVHAAEAAASRYLRALAGGRSVAGMERPQNGAGGCSLRALDGWMRRVPLAQLRVVTASIGDAKPGTVDVLVTLSARLGGPPGTVSISLGQRVLEVAGGRQPRIAADLSSVRGGRPSGLAAVPDATYAVSPSGVVVSDGASAADARMALEALNGSYLAMARRYGSLGLRRPIVALLPSRQVVEQVVGYPVSPWEAGLEIQGLVFMIGPEWCCGDWRQGIVVHELAHAATRRMVLATPTSMVEGVAAYEEQNWDAAHGAPLPAYPLADAYRTGWQGTSAWGWEFSEWYRVPQRVLYLRYDDGAAVVRQVVREAGTSGLRRLARAFRAHHGVTWLSPAQLNAVFEAAIGRSFTQVEAAARSAAITGG